MTSDLEQTLIRKIEAGTVRPEDFGPTPSFPMPTSVNPDSPVAISCWIGSC